MAKQPRSVIAQFFWLLSNRPAHVLRAGRGFLFFQFSRFVRALPGGLGAGVSLGRNVRLQRNGSLMAELPNGKITIGDHTIVYEDAKIEAYGSGAISIGSETVVGGAQICSRYGITLGNRVLTSWNVFIQDFDSHPVEQGLRSKQVIKIIREFRPSFIADGGPVPDLGGWNFPGETITIGDDVWIGANATILKGANIGAGCVIASGSVVLRGTYPARSLIAGNPASVVKELPQ